MTLIFKEMPIAIDTDVKDKSALIVTMDCGCALNCICCHYFLHRRKQEKCSIIPALVKIENFLRIGVVDCIVLTGGEVTIDKNMQKLLFIIEYLQWHFENIEIVVNTNGQYPENIKKLLEKNITFHIDIKMSPEFFGSNDIIIGRSNYSDTYLKLLKKSLHHIYKSNSKKHVLRTVNYPIHTICPEDLYKNVSYVESIENFVNDLNSKYNKKLDWYVNKFTEFREI